MALLVNTTMLLLFVTMGCFFTALCNVNATIEPLPSHGNHPTIAPSPHRHHHQHPKIPAPSPYHHNPHSPAHAAMHHSPIPAPPHHTPVAPIHPAPVKTPIHPPTKAPLKAPVHPPTKAPFKAPIHPPTKTPVKAPVHPPTKAPVKKPIHPPTKSPVKPPVDHFHTSSVVVYGTVYCKPCLKRGIYIPGLGNGLGASILPGATVKLECNNTNHPITVEAKSNSMGHFYLEAPNTITAKDAHKCKVFLVSSPTKCNQIANLNGGLNGAVLKFEKTFTGKKLSFSLYTVAPLAFKPKICLFT